MVGLRSLVEPQSHAITVMAIRPPMTARTMRRCTSCAIEWSWSMKARATAKTIRHANRQDEVTASPVADASAINGRASIQPRNEELAKWRDPTRPTTIHAAA